MSHARSAGFAMIDVLVALLLMAVVLTGACATLIQTMRATHAALLATRAVDLAADLTEALRGVDSVAEAEPLVSAWRVRVSAALPVAGMEPEEYAGLVAVAPADASGAEDETPRLQVQLRWRDGTEGTVRELALPVTIPAG